MPAAFAQSELIVTEIHYHSTVANQEFVEIKNVGDEPQNMTGWTVGGIGDVTYTQTVIQPGGFLVLAENSAGFNGRYGFFPGGTYTGSLRNSGEEVELRDPSLIAVFSVDYWDGDDPTVGMEAEEADRPNWPRDPDGDGYTLVPQNPDINTDPNDYRNWRPSINLGGSPGADEPLPVPLQPIFINEIRTRDGAASNDAIEFFNPNGSDVNISNWFLSDNLDDPKKSPVPAGTIVAAGGYLVLENGIDGFLISLSSRGERVFLYSADGAGNLTGFVNGLHFLASGDGQTFSRYLNSEGTEQFPAAAPSLGGENSSPDVGPVVITEIMYNPEVVGGTDEFIEIQNISDQTVNLFDPLNTGNNWRVEGINYILPGTQPTLAPGEIALITPTAPATFIAAHDVPASIQVFGPYTGSTLSNGGEEVALQRPENLDDMDPGDTSYINVDVVLYDNSSPWPTDADGFGRSLVRIDRSAYGNDPINWEASLLLEGSPGVIFDYTGPEILVNEILAHTDIPQVDVIELFNPTDADVNIGRWWLSDDKDDPKKFQIPSGTMISTLDFWAVNQDNDANEASAPASYFGNAFQISSRGDQIYLFSADATGELTGYRHGFSFRATVNGSAANGNQTLGRHIDSFGREHLTKMVRSVEVNRFTPNPTGFPNTEPIVGPIVFTEINLSPADGDVEFIELKNISGGSVRMYDTTVGGNTNNNWSIDGVTSDGADTYRIPGFQRTLPAGAVLIILPMGTDVATFRTDNSVPAEPEAFVIGGADGYLGALNNGGEELALLRPDNPDNVNGTIIVPQIAVDVVNYLDSAFWPTVAAGLTLEKHTLTGFGDDPAFWRASNAVGGNPGVTATGLIYDVWAADNFTAEELGNPAISSCDADANGDGVSNVFAYAFNYDPHTSPAGSNRTQAAIVSDGGLNFAAITFRRQTAAVDISYTVEYSNDLQTWSVLAGVEVGAPVDNGDGTETIQIRGIDAAVIEVRQFLRLRITKS